MYPANIAAFTGSIQTQAREKFGEKGAWAYPGTAQIFFEYPLLSPEWVKLRTSNLAGVFTGYM